MPVNGLFQQTQSKLWNYLYGESLLLPESPDQKSMTIRAVQTQAVNGRLTFGRINYLPNSDQRKAACDTQKLRGSRIRGRSVNLFVGISKFKAVIAVQNGEQ